MVSLALHYKLLGVFLLLIMVHKLILVIPKLCDVLFATLIQLIWMLIMFFMGKIRALWAITKTMGHFLWKNIYFMNMWRRVKGGTCCCHKKLKEMETNKKQQNNNNIPSFLSMNFLATIGFITKLTLHNIPFLKFWSYTLPFMAEAHGFRR